MGSTPPPRCAVAPDTAPRWLGAAAVEGGASLADLQDAEILLWWQGPPAALAEAAAAAPALRWIQLPSAGVEAYADVLDDRWTVTCAKGVYGEPVAEHALALALAGLRGIGTYGRATRWTAAQGSNLFGADVVVLGGGGIATSLLSLLQPFRVHTTVVRRHPQSMDGAPRVVGLDRLHHVLPQADLVVLALALTSETAGVIGAAELELLKPTTWIVNVSRGAHIVTDDLVDALRRGAIGGAALDVTDPEPLPEHHPLWTMDRCLLTPHVGNTLSMLRPRLLAFIRENVRRYIAGEPLAGRVDLGLGY